MTDQSLRDRVMEVLLALQQEAREQADPEVNAGELAALAAHDERKQRQHQGLMELTGAEPDGED